MVTMNEGSVFPIIDLAPATAAQIATLGQTCPWEQPAAARGVIIPTAAHQSESQSMAANDLI
jgi:hypothetical protein